MNEFIVVAYPDPEYGLPKQEKTIIAATLESAKEWAYQLFPEYHEIGVYEKKS